MIALVVIGGFASFYVGVAVGLLMRRRSFEDAFHEGREVGREEAERRANAEVDALLYELERSA